MSGTLRVELVYFSGCPNIELARTNLKEAMARLGLPPNWTEWDGLSPDCPATFRQLGSPTILVQGRAVDADMAGESRSCSLYRDADGRLVGAPVIDAIITALRTAGSHPESWVKA